MTNLKTLSLVALLACFVQAQDEKPEGDVKKPKKAERRERRRPSDPLLETIDANKDKTISAEEIKGSSKALLSLDKDKDGMLSREECGGRAPGERGGDMFARMDTNKDGKISKEEAPDRLKGAFADYDKNGDGFLDAEERKALIDRRRQGGKKKPEGDTKPEGKDGEKPERPEGAERGARGGERGGRGGEHGMRRGGGSPMMRALDTDRNQELSVQEIENAPEALIKLDKNKDGKLAGDEIAPSRRGGRGDFIARLDTDGDGKISRKEAPERMAQFFDRMDADGDGFITKEEIEEMRRSMGGGRGGRGGGRGGEGGRER
ncbi:MAG: EF-hand domain-containing protein [Planctomycetota bacterium]|jgi:Ca2+-binding EF-hand superfamily protein